MNYRGKWVSKQDSEETGVQMIDVIQVDGNEVKAIGRNLTLTELLSNFQRLEDSNINIPDPFALDPSMIHADLIVEDEEQPQPQHEDKSADKIFKYPEDLNVKQAIEPENLESTRKLVIGQAVPTRKYTSEEETIFNMIKVIRQKANSSDDIELKLNVKINFNIQKLLVATYMMGFDIEIVKNVISTEIAKFITHEKFIDSITEAIDSESIDNESLGKESIDNE